MKQLLMLTAILALIGCSSDNSSMSVSVGPDVSGVDLEEETMSSSEAGEGTSSSNVDTKEQTSSSSIEVKRGTSSSSVDEFTANCKDDYLAIYDTDLRLSVPQVFYLMQRIYGKEHTLECVKAMYPTLVDEFYVEREFVYVEQCDMEIECPVEVEVDETMHLVSTIRCDLVEKNLMNFLHTSCPNVARAMESDGFYVEKVGPDTGEVKFYD